MGSCIRGLLHMSRCKAPCLDEVATEKNIYLKEIPLVEALEIYVQSHYEAVITYRK